jgi:hypothetical protein
VLQRLTLALPERERVALRDEILRRSQHVPSYTRTHATNAWRSASDLHTWPTAAVFCNSLIQLLQASARLPIEPKTLRAWAIVSRRGSAHGRHIHPQRFAWSGVYYLEPGGADSARTVFETAEGLVPIAPERDLAIVFPADLWHSVEPHPNDDMRVTIAFNIEAKPGCVDRASDRV